MSKCKNCGTPPTPSPYYEQVSQEAVQDHAAIFNDTKYAAGIKVKEEFQIPAVDSDIQVCVKNITDLVIGSYLWHPSYGSLKIVHWDSCSGKIGLLNEGLNGTPPPGTVVPEGTLFLADSRPCCADQDNFQLFPFLAENFTAPGVGDQVTLSVTSTFGLAVGTVVRIGTGLYYLDTINSSLEIVVTNQGAGHTPGTLVEAKDANGDFQYLITSQIVTACSSTVVDEGRLIVCDGADEHILDGDFAGMVPVLQNTSTDEVQFKLLDTDVRTCTVLTAPLNITALDPSYTIDVDDESIFQIGQVLQLNFTSLRWEVTDNTTPGELDITCTNGNPGVTVTYLTGSAVCLQFTTEIIYEDVAIAILELETAWVKKADTALYNSIGLYTVAFTVLGDIEAALKVGLPIRLKINGVYKYTHVNTFTYAFSPVPGETYIEAYIHGDFTIIITDTLEDFSISYGSPADFPSYFFVAIAAFGGFSSQPGSRVCQYSITNGWVDMEIYGTNTLGISNATSFTMPVPIQLSSSNSVVGYASDITDNSVLAPLVMTPIYFGGFHSITINHPSGAWTASGTKNAIAKLRFLMDH